MDRQIEQSTKDAQQVGTPHRWFAHWPVLIPIPLVGGLLALTHICGSIDRAKLNLMP